MNISPLTSTPGSVVDEECESGKGYISVERYAKKHRPKVMVLENVAGVFNKRKTEDGQTAFFVFQDILFLFIFVFLKILPCGTISLIK